MQEIVAWARDIMTMAREEYGVDPVIFLAIMLASTPFYYYSIYQLIRSAVKKTTKNLGLWSSVFMAATVAPFLYVLIYGRNMPLWVYGIIALMIGQGVVSLIRKIMDGKRKKTEAQTPPEPYPPPERQLESSSAAAQDSSEPENDPP